MSNTAEHTAKCRPTPCHYCNMFVARDEEDRFYATSPSIKEPWECPANPSGHLIVTAKTED